MAGPRVVVARPVADDAQAEHVAVEADRALHVGADQGEVVQAGDLHAPWLARHVLKPTPARLRNALRKPHRPMPSTTTAATRTNAGATPARPSAAADTTAGNAASSVECERKPVKCSRTAVSSPATDAS